MNKQGRAITEMFQSATVMIVVRESKLRLTVFLLKNRQRRYWYRLLGAPKTQLTEDIPPVTLTDGEGQVQSGELPENNGKWAKLLHLQGARDTQTALGPDDNGRNRHSFSSRPGAHQVGGAIDVQG